LRVCGAGGAGGGAGRGAKPQTDPEKLRRQNH